MRKEALRLFGPKKDAAQNGVTEAGELPPLHTVLFDIFDEFTAVVTARTFWKKLIALSGDPSLISAVSTKLASVVLDVLAVQTTEFEEIGNTERHTFLKDLLQSGWRELLVKESEIVARFSVPSAALILNVPEANLSRSYRLSISKHFFTLPEFNLLREESEGFSKLISFLLSANLASQGDTFASTINNIVGAFSLHPNRVLDLVLSASGFHLDKYFDVNKNCATFEAYSQSVSPILSYLKTPPKSHIYSLLAFNMKPKTPAATSTAVASSATATSSASSSSASKSDDVAMSLSLTTCRILAMLLRFGILDQTAVLDLITIADPKPKKEAIEKLPEAEGDEDDLVLPPEPKPVNEVFLASSRLQLLAALLEIPDADPLALLEDSSIYASLIEELSEPRLFGVHRIASVFAGRLSAHFAPVYAAFSPSNWLHNLASPAPSFDELAQSLFRALPILLNMGETVSAQLHHVLCTLCSVLVGGIISLEQRKDDSDKHGSDLRLMRLPSLIENSSPELRSRVYRAVEELIEKVLLPSFACISVNADSMWNLLSKWPFGTRYRWYHSWARMPQQQAYPSLKAVVTDSRNKIKAMMKRMTDDSIKETGRPLCKNVNKFPPAAADLIGSLNFSNFVQPLAESMRYLTDISLDVLVYGLMDASVNMAAVNPTPHFLNIATFISVIFKIYYERVDIVPLLDIIEQLMRRSKLAGASFFTTLLSKMGCTDILEDTLSPNIIMRHSFPSLHKLASAAVVSKENSRSSIVPLRDRLWQSNSWLPLYILTLQLKSQYAYHAEFKDVSRISNPFDTVHQLALQLAEFTSHIFHKYSSQIHTDLLMSAGQIVQEYGLAHGEVLHLFRPILHLIYADVAQLIGSTSPMITGSSASEMDVDKTSVPKLRLADDLEFSRAGHAKTLLFFPLEDSLRAAFDAVSPSSDPDDEYAPRKTSLESLAHVFPLSASFLSTFWGLRLIDVECNESIYKQSIVKQTQEQQNSAFASASATKDKSHEISASAIQKDLDSHFEHVSAVTERLKSSCAQDGSKAWFLDIAAQLRSNPAPKIDAASNEKIASELDNLGETEKKRIVTNAVLQHCIIPRAMISAEDAIFCASFIRTLHHINPPLWDTDIFMDLFFSTMPLMMTSTSTNESSRFGRLASGILGLLTSWRDFDTWFNDLGGREIALPEPSTLGELTLANEGVGMNVDEAPSGTAGEEAPTDGHVGTPHENGDHADPSAMDVTEAAQATDSTVTKSEPVSPIRAAHQLVCEKSLNWELQVVEHITKSVESRDKWTQRAVLFFLKEVNTVFPSCQRYLELVGHTMKKFATSGGVEDVKPLLNSYLNLLENRQRTITPHEEFSAQYPGFVFPDAPPAIARPSMSVGGGDDASDTQTQSREETPALTPSLELSRETARDTTHTPPPTASSQQADSTASSRRGRGSRTKRFEDTPLPAPVAKSSTPAPETSSTSIAPRDDHRPSSSAHRSERDEPRGGDRRDRDVRGHNGPPDDFRGTNGSRGGRDFRDGPRDDYDERLRRGDKRWDGPERLPERLPPRGNDRAPERAPDRPSDRPSDRASDRPSDRPSDRGSSERGSDRPFERNDRGPERGSDRGDRNDRGPSDRGSDRGPERGSDRVERRGGDREMDRGNERGGGPSERFDRGGPSDRLPERGERGNDRNDRGSDRGERGPDRERGSDRSFDRGPDRPGLDRSDRAPSDSRNLDRGPDRGPDRGGDRFADDRDRGGFQRGSDSRDQHHDDNRGSKKRGRGSEPEPPPPGPEKRAKLAEPSSSNNDARQRPSEAPRDEVPLPPRGRGRRK